MSYKERMHPTVSKAETDLFKALSLAGLTGGMSTQLEIPIKSTKPDFVWPSERIAIYLDGDKVHDEDDDWDQLVVETLQRRGWKVKRIRYTAPITQAALADALLQIAEVLKRPLRLEPGNPLAQHITNQKDEDPLLQLKRDLEGKRMLSVTGKYGDGLNGR